jgi:hypothetical protein
MLHNVYLGNNILVKKWTHKQNEYMSNKLEQIHPFVDRKCPESFTNNFRSQSLKRRQYDADCKLYFNNSKYIREKKKQYVIV